MTANTKAKIKVYVGCGLTHAPKRFRKEVDKFKVSLRGRGYEVLDFAGLSGGDSYEECRKVYEYDIIRCVGTCDIFVGICDFPSTGLGYEIAYASRRGIPIILVAQREAKVTRLILGIPTEEAQFSRYGLLSDAVGVVDEFAHKYTCELAMGK